MAITIIAVSACLGFVAGWLARRRLEPELLVEAFRRGVRAEALARVLLEDVPRVTLPGREL